MIGGAPVGALEVRRDIPHPEFQRLQRGLRVRPLVVHREHPADAARALDDGLDGLDGLLGRAHDQAGAALDRLFD